MQLNLKFLVKFSGLSITPTPTAIEKDEVNATGTVALTVCRKSYWHMINPYLSCVSSFKDKGLKLLTHDQSSATSSCSLLAIHQTPLSVAVSWAHEGQCGPSHQDLMVTTLHAGEIDGSVLSPEWTTAKEGLWATLTTMPVGTLTTMPNISPLLYARNSSWSKESAMRAYFTIKLGKQLARIHCICKW